MKTLRSVFLGAVACLAVGAAGCSPTLYAQPVASGAVPADVGLYPHVYYKGTYVYNVNGIWYRPTATGWAYYPQAPKDLRRYEY